MSKIATYPPGTIVRIMRWELKPGNWNDVMFDSLSGRKAVIRSSARSDNINTYRYTLEGYEWSWRHCDLMLIELPKPEPNRAFRNKKRGIR